MRSMRYCAILLFTMVSFGLSQTVLYEESFPGGVAELNWMAADGQSQLQIDTNTPNPSGDNTIGFVEGIAAIGGTGSVIAGDASLTDYKVEAQVFIYRNASASSGTNNGIYGRVSIEGSAFNAYVLNADFDANPRLRLRKFEASAPPGSPPTVIRDWDPTEIPGGLPTADGWHKLTLEFQGDQIWAYYDDVMLDGSPFADTQSASGFFGVYTFVGFGTTDDPDTKFDDVVVTAMTTGNEDDFNALAAETFTLNQNYPNPFNPSTTISYAINQPTTVQVEVFNLFGQRVALLEEGFKTIGDYQIDWNAANNASGTYLLRVMANGQVQTRKMQLLK